MVYIYSSVVRVQLLKNKCVCGGGGGGEGGEAVRAFQKKGRGLGRANVKLLKF